MDKKKADGELTKGSLPMGEETVLDMCIQIEKKLEEFYDFLADIHKSNPKISSLWRKTAREEANHARQILLSRKASRDVMVAKVVVDGEKAHKALHQVEAKLVRFKLEHPDIPTALSVAIKFEAAFAAFHLENAVLFTQERHKKMFQAMMSADRDHVAVLEQALLEITGQKTPVPT